jgi:Protein of unknown function (DUF1217)
MGTSISYLTGLYGLNSGTGSSSLLATLYGFAGQSTNALGQDPVQALAAAEKNQTTEVKATAAQPAIKRAVDAFTAGVNSAKSVQQLLANPAVMQVLLTANGLGDQVSYTALARKALQSDLADPKSLANTLTDQRWKTMAQTYDFAGKGLSIIQQPKVISAVADAYAEVTWRQSLDATTPGLSNALTFRGEAANISSVLQILGDPVMRNVVTTALGLPLQIAFQPLEAQEKAISTRLDITKFQDPKFVESFVQRYLLAASSSGTGTTGTANLTTLAVQSGGLVV